MSRFALEALGVCKRYGNRDALSHVNLVAEFGRVHGLLGPNGAGKTTLMRIVLGLVRRDSGTVFVLGRSMDGSTNAVPDGVAGFVETPAFYPYLTGRRNLSLLSRLDGDGTEEGDTKVSAALEDVGLTLHADAVVSGYSAGMRQRLGVAAALIRAPRLLFLDEPTSSLDPAGARNVRAIARRLADSGAAIILSSHDMAEVEDLCDTLTVLDRGQVIFDGTAGKLRERARGQVHALHTSDDRAALEMARALPGIRIGSSGTGMLELAADTDTLDEYVIALGRAGVAVRKLERRARSLESLFIELTDRSRGKQDPVSPNPDLEVISESDERVAS
jgi:ABC-2 type transport system ATP-binding protein